MRLLSRVARYLALAVVLSAAGCRSAARPPAMFGETRARSQIRLEVTNNNFNDATLHSIKNGNERRLLGTVTGKSSSVYTLTWADPASLQIEIDFLAGGRCTTRALNADPGDQIVLQIGIDDSQRECDVSD